MTRVKPFICTMPLKLDDGWNQIQLNLSDLTRRAYGTNYVETLRVQVHANCRLRRIYFSDRLYSEEELPPEFKLYLPMQVKLYHVTNIIIRLLFHWIWLIIELIFFCFHIAESLKQSHEESYLETILSIISEVHLLWCVNLYVLGCGPLASRHWFCDLL